MKIYRNKENKNLYTITHLVLDIKHLNNNEYAGVYADPYTWKGEQVIFHSKKWDECISFIRDNFEVVSEANFIR